MYPVCVPDLNILLAMAALDSQIAEDARKDVCPLCTGSLHQATWQRKPRGVKFDLPESSRPAGDCAAVSVVDGCYPIRCCSAGVTSTSRP